MNHHRDQDEDVFHPLHLPTVRETESLVEAQERCVDGLDDMMAHLDDDLVKARAILTVRRGRYLAGSRIRMWIGVGFLPGIASGVAITGWGTAAGSWLSFGFLVAAVTVIMFAISVSDRKAEYSGAKKTRASYQKQYTKRLFEKAEEQVRLEHLRTAHEANLRLPAKVRFLADALQFPDQTVTAVRTATDSITLVKPGSLWAAVGRAAGWDDTVTVLVEEISRTLTSTYGRA